MLRLYNNDVKFDVDLDVIRLLICDIALRSWCSNRKCLDILFKSRENNGWYFKIDLDLDVIRILICDINPETWCSKTCSNNLCKSKGEERTGSIYSKVILALNSVTRHFSPRVPLQTIRLCPNHQSLYKPPPHLQTCPIYITIPPYL